jgi:very-short-patch-repair endonuclease
VGGNCGSRGFWEKCCCGNNCAAALRGYQFNRQKPLDKYIVDFYCRKLNLVIELNGASHDHDDAYLSDVNREIVLREMGLHLLRFSEKEVRYQMQDVLERISQWIDEEKKESP